MKLHPGSRRLSHLLPFILASVAGCYTAATPDRPPSSIPPPVTHFGDEPVDAGAPVVPPPPRSAIDTVRESLNALPLIPAPEAAWLPSRLMVVIGSSTSDLPIPTPPRFHGDAVLWGLLSLPGADPAHAEHGCDAVRAAEPRVACATDTTVWSGADRIRTVLGWRAASGSDPITLVTPLRALARLAPPGTCLVSAQRTERTLDLTVRVLHDEALGHLLASVTSAPGLSDLILVRTDAHGAGVEALLSWPFDRADPVHATMEDDPWPARCDGADAVAQGAAAHTVPIARSFISGTHAQGAVMTVAHQDWVVTTGDAVASVTVTGADEHGVTVRYGTRPRPARLTYLHGP